MSRFVSSFPFNKPSAEARKHQKLAVLKIFAIPSSARFNVQAKCVRVSWGFEQTMVDPTFHDCRSVPWVGVPSSRSRPSAGTFRP